MISQPPKSIFLRYEWVGVIFALALVLTFVPMLVSAASTVLNLTGVGLSLAFVAWVYCFFRRIANYN